MVAPSFGPGLVAKAVTDRYAIAALVRTRALETQLLAAVRACEGVEHISVIWCTSPEDLFAAAVDREAVLAIVEWQAGDYELEALVRRLRDEFPSVPVLAYAPLTSAGARGLLAAGRAGVREAIIAGHDDAGRALSGVLARAATASAAERAVDWISDFVMPDVLPILAFVLRHARSAPRVSEIARALHVSVKALIQRCRRSDAPLPGELAIWGRLVIAAERLADDGRSSDRVASEFGFVSAAALGKTLERYTGLTLPQIRAAGPGVVLECLAGRLTSARLGQPGRPSAEDILNEISPPQGIDTDWGPLTPRAD